MAEFILSAFADEAGSTIEEQINALVRNRIPYVEPRNIGGKGILELTDEEIAEVKQKLDAAGIKVYSVGSPIGKYPISEPFEPYIETFERALKVAKMLGAENIRIFSFFNEDKSYAEVKDEVYRRMKYMCERAAEYGICLCHENESRIYGQMPQEVSELLSDIDGLYGIFDPANFVMNGADALEGFEATLPHFKYMHIKDAIFASETIVPAGEGEGHIPEVLARIDTSLDRTVTLTLEPHLALFDAYKSIDEHELKGKYSFKSQGEAFDFAAGALKGVLTSLGYHETEDYTWKR